MVGVLLAVGIVVAAFVGFNIGGSSTGVAFGPAVGAGTISKLGAAALMTVFALAGGLTVGREVVAFRVSGVIGRYLYPTLVEWFAITRSERVLFVLDRSGPLPRLRLGRRPPLERSSGRS